jgi:hypothetical protein
VAKKVWTFKVKGQHHVVELEHSYWSARGHIVVDGVPLYSGCLYDKVHHFDIAGVPCVLRVKAKTFGFFDYELFVDRKKIERSA